mgnify:CR=1 FL=1
MSNRSVARFPNSSEVRASLFRWKVALCKKRRRDQLKTESFAKQFREIVAGGGFNAQHAAVEVGLENLLNLLEQVESRDLEAKANA